jgi:hypothetical protein
MRDETGVTPVPANLAGRFIRLHLDGGIEWIDSFLSPARRWVLIT